MTAVLVIGMHRSGTSLMTSLLGIAGAYLGTPDEMMPADQWNAAGYWEHIGFKNINDRLLAQFGGSWLAPPILPEGWLDLPEVKALSDEAKALIQKEFADRPLWALKDPRASIVLPFWQRVIESPRYVMCVRNPLAVADSLLNRDEMPIEYSTALWHIYTLRSLLDTSEKDRLILLYDDIVKDPVAAAAPLFEFLGVSDKLSDPDIRKAVAGTVDQKLKHHQYSLDDLKRHSGTLSSTSRLYESLQAGNDAAIETALAEGGTLEHALYTITGAYGAAHMMIQELRKKTDELDGLRAELQHKRDILNSRLHRMADAGNRWILGRRKR